MQMAITPDGSVLAVLDDKSLLTLHFLDEATSEWKMLSEASLWRYFVKTAESRLSLAVNVPMSFKLRGTGWNNEFTSPGQGHLGPGPFTSPNVTLLQTRVDWIGAL